MKVKGKVNTKKAGAYKVQCTITDPYTAVSVTKTFTFKVGKKPKQTGHGKGSSRINYRRKSNKGVIWLLTIVTVDLRTLKGIGYNYIIFYDTGGKTYGRTL